MISAKLQNAINKQIQVEMNSANIYLAMSLYSETQSLGGFASCCAFNIKKKWNMRLSL